MLESVEDIIRAIALGIVQGLTEFLPISSSGHLIITRELFGWEFADDLTFDVALHIGTLIAVITYFWGEWVSMLRGLLSRLVRLERDHRFSDVYDERLLVIVLLGSVPVGVVGLALDSWAEDELRDPLIAGAMLVVFGGILFAAERLGRRERPVESAGWKDAVLIGGAQALSLIPGVSRSGVTISAGLFDGFKRVDAARLSFLLATPAIGGAGLFKLAEAITDGVPTHEISAIFVGAAVSAIVGWLSIRFLMRLVQTRTYVPFVAYRVAVGIFALVYFGFS
jgi:undecaprenyl-diphosphatase